MDWRNGGGGAGGGSGDGGGGAEGAGPGTAPLHDATSGYDKPDPHVPAEPPPDAVRPPPPPPPPPTTLPKDPPVPAIAEVGDGQDNHISPPAGTPFTGPLPSWVLEVTKTTQVDVEVAYPKGASKTRRTIKLYWFRLLGIGFMDGNVKGVNRGMLKRLFRAQEDLYRLYREQMGAPPDDAEDQKRFRAFCQAKELVGGQGPRGGGNHRDGSAIDIEYTASPWVPIYGNQGLVGEVHNGRDTGVAWSRTNVWEPCAEVYKRASLFCFGRNVRPSKASDPSRSYDVFKETHDALVRYLSYRYPKGQAGDLTETSKAEFIARLRAEKDTDLKDCHLYFLDEGQTKLESRALGSVTDDSLQKAFAQIAEDRKTMRYGMVIMSLQIKNDKIDESATNYREPCKGFLMIKKEVVLALLKTGLRWGGQDFGDMMHFDMGTEILNEFYDLRVKAWANGLLTEIGETSDGAMQKLKEAAATIVRAVESAGTSANEASLAGNTAKEDACWAAVAAADALQDKLKSAKSALTKLAGDKGASDAKKQRAEEAVDLAIATAKKVEDDAKRACAM